MLLLLLILTTTLVMNHTYLILQHQEIHRSIYHLYSLKMILLILTYAYLSEI
jgi:hypothetical protein